MRRFFNLSTLVFLIIVGFLAFWIGGGMLNREPPQEVVAPQIPIPVVAASFSEAELVTPEAALYGDVVPNQIAVVRNRVGGLVEDVTSLGAQVQPGDALARISADAREASLAQAQAQLSSAERDYEAARTLAQRGVSSDAERQSRFAQLESARAGVRAAELELANTEITAPIGGTVSNVIAEAGSFVPAGSEILEIVDNDPLIARVEVRQSEIGQIRRGMTAQVEFTGGIQREGQISFISPIATAQTRTFRVEVEIPNPDTEIPAGLSAEIRLPLATQKAHKLSPALIRLDDQGRVGLMAIDETGDHLIFHPIDIVQARADAIWVTGLPDRVQLVTISQGALNSGQQVRVEETPENYRGILGGWGGNAATDSADSQAASAAAAGIAGDSVQTSPLAAPEDGPEATTDATEATTDSTN
ncbi:MAG: efflux RND transporter periplasmic adaptor subunit [Paracoccus sp. (in: a-proteobacteria)]|nr:efflux RND transporter periplasmic adaptor subunit [Paracoccus sp. (in: a-proteobacteria)]